MTSTIQLKTGTGSAVPSTLSQGEIAINVDNGLFYYGSGSGKVVKKLEEFAHITSSGNISSSGILRAGTPGARHEHYIYGRLHVIGSDVTIGDGHITASGNIEVEGNISASAASTASFAHIITQGDTIEFRTGASKLGSIKFDDSNGFQALDNSGNRKSSRLGDISAKHITGSNISSSLAGTISAGSGSYHILQGDTSKATGLFIDGTITASGDISSSSTANITIGGTLTAGTLDAAAVSDGLAAVIVSEIDNDEIPIAKLAEDAVTITAGDGLKTGGSVTLGSSVTLDIDVSDFAGTGLSGDVSENLNIDAAQTGITSVTHALLKVGRATDDTYIDFGTDDKIQLKPANSTALEAKTTGVDITGKLYASGDISASMTSTVSAASASFNVLKSNDASVNGLEVTGFVSASNQSLSATGSFDKMTKAIVIETFTYFVNSSHTSELYVPLGGSTSEYTYDNYINKFACPYNGKVKRVSLQWQQNNPGNGAQVRVKKDTANSGAQDGDIGDSNAIFETVSKDSVVADTIYHYDFSSSFAKGDTIGITVHTPNIATSNEYIYGTLVMEMDTSS
jgi:hypothetical protein